MLGNFKIKNIIKEFVADDKIQTSTRKSTINNSESIKTKGEKMTKEKKLKFTLNRENIEHRRFLEKAYKQGKDKGLSDESLTEYTKQTAQKLYNERAI